jgi:hypothetical protein
VGDGGGRREDGRGVGMHREREEIGLCGQKCRDEGEQECGKQRGVQEHILYKYLNIFL